MDIRLYDSEIRRFKESKLHKRRQRALSNKKSEIIQNLGSDLKAIENEKTARSSAQFKSEGTPQRLGDGMSSNKQDAVSSNYSDLNPISISSSLDLNTDY